jgi:hypothetical protein
MQQCSPRVRPSNEHTLCVCACRCAIGHWHLRRLLVCIRQENPIPASLDWAAHEYTRRTRFPLFTTILLVLSTICTNGITMAFPEPTQLRFIFPSSMTHCGWTFWENPITGLRSRELQAHLVYSSYLDHLVRLLVSRYPDFKTVASHHIGLWQE